MSKLLNFKEQEKVQVSKNDDEKQEAHNLDVPELNNSTQTLFEETQSLTQ